MSAGGIAIAPARTDEPPLWQRLLSAPPQGWASVALVGIMLAICGLAVDESRWAGFTADGASQTSFLLAAFLLSGLLGYLFARSRLSVTWSHLIASGLGAAFLLNAVAEAISDAPTLEGRLHALADSAGVFYNDIFVLGARSTETSPFLLIIGAIAWTTGYFAAYNVFRRSRGMPAVVACGLVLFVNMSITARLQYPYLIALCVAAMLLLVRLNLAQQQQGWRLRRIGDAKDVAPLFLGGGVLFVGFTLVGAVALAATASSAPLSSFWRNMDDQLVSITIAINRLVGGVTGPTKQTGGLFGSAETIRGVWESTSTPIFDAVPSDGQPHYWQGATYDDFDGLTWTQDDRQSSDVGAGQELLAGSTDRVTNTEGRQTVAARITSLALGGGTLLGPESPLTVDRNSQVRTSGPGGPMVSIDFSDAIDPGQSYVVTSQVLDEKPVAPSTGPQTTTGITGNQLAAAGVTYPDWISRYIAIRPNSIGQLTIDTAHKVVNSLPANQRDPYHVAQAIQTFLDSTGGFQYRTDVRGLCGRESVVDCLLTTKQGYCQHFATAMVMLLRVEGIPARFVEGYLPGKLLANGAWRVDQSAAHAWVEVWFPSYGWIRFDPTPGNTENGRVATELPAGPAVAAASPGASPSPLPSGISDPDLPLRAGGTRPLPAPTAPDPGPMGALAVTALLCIAVALGLYARYRRALLAPPEPDVAYKRLARFATRLGYAPTPSQTAYEYAGSLAELMPGIRQELQVVAHAKVEATYARRFPHGEAVAVLRSAYRRVRLGLVRLRLRFPRRHSL